MATKQEAQAEGQVQEQEVEQAGLLDQILTEGRMARDEFQKDRAKDMIAEYVKQVMSGEMTLSRNMDATINARIAEIDRLISEQMNEIMHHEEFQKLEGSWRGLHHLVSNSLTGPMLKIRVMSVNKKELLKDFERALEFDQSRGMCSRMNRFDGETRTGTLRSGPPQYTGRAGKWRRFALDFGTSEAGRGSGQ
jgi:type VI secretion system protein ImpC